RVVHRLSNEFSFHGISMFRSPQYPFPTQYSFSTDYPFSTGEWYQAESAQSDYFGGSLSSALIIQFRMLIAGAVFELQILERYYAQRSHRNRTLRLSVMRLASRMERYSILFP
ncbi:MAG: hypothetical protein KDD69_14490, partial [Bdellovibrionales bacterium]|nr:hypothetical protein [Bdellovibrionales bacterium]